ncbi:nucleotide disphospho-sugar-binding domain-containing protein [Arthrobacter sp. AL12]|uniref:glycosyltransferase n=1 Tax=Arthrobacter sp. AL12 TaxID=3042241 RepID=UPI0032B81DDC
MWAPKNCGGDIRSRTSLSRTTSTLPGFLPFTDVFVTNGGFGGVLLSLSHGVPLVTAGLNEGKSDVNARVAYAGVGVNLKTENPSAAAIRSAVDTVLGDPSLRERAQAMRGQFEAEDSVGAAVEVIKAVVAG